MEYRHAAELKPQELPALEGLASVQMGVNSVQEGVATYAHLVGCSFTVQYPILLPNRDPVQHGISHIDKRNWWQVKLARTKSDLAKQREFLWRAAEALDRIGDLEAAEIQLKALLKMPLDSEEQRIEALCFLADLQVHNYCMCTEPTEHDFVRLLLSSMSGAELRCAAAAPQSKREARRQDERLDKYLGQQEQHKGLLKRSRSTLRLQVSCWLRMERV